MALSGFFWRALCACPATYTDIALRPGAGRLPLPGRLTHGAVALCRLARSPMQAQPHAIGQKCLKLCVNPMQNLASICLRLY